MAMSEHPRFELALTGCRPEPLASYLKALGVFRLIAEQKDRDARGFWRGQHFVLRSRLDRNALITFFLDEWRPTPVIAPWNGGSGFYRKDNREAPEAILGSTDPRLAGFARSLRVGREFIAARGWEERPSNEEKAMLFARMRATLPDEALAWIDAVVVLGNERLLFPPLLGTGGNDGRLDFSNNFQQRVVEVFESRSELSLDASLFGTPTTSSFKGTMGQFQPAAGERSNPWSFVLLIEGAMVFAAAATRCMESAPHSALAFPFHARAAGGTGSLADSDVDAGRDELWLPLWNAPASLSAVRRLFAEGRATVGAGEQARAASSALDFARAVTALGVDRGIDEFTRVGFLVRNGLSYFATPLGRYKTGEVPGARLLDDFDPWFSRFREKASGSNTPARIALGRRRLEQAMFEAVTSGDVAPVLLELGAVEHALGRSLAFANTSFLAPPPRLPGSWAAAVEDGSVEQRLAAALATRRGMRGRLAPIEPGGRSFGRNDEPGFVFGDRPLVDNLHGLLRREEIESRQTDSDPATSTGIARCALSDVAEFIAGRTDDMLIERWLRALVLVEGGLAAAQPASALLPPASFAVLALAHHRRVRNEVLPLTAGLLSAACSGNSADATARAIRRLQASGHSIPMTALAEPPARMRRIAAALAIPLTHEQRLKLEAMVLPSAEHSPPRILDHAQEQA